MKDIGKAARLYAWQELSNPRTFEEKGGTQGYYDFPRPELINLLDHIPRTVLDVGCAGGATGARLKEQYPSAVVTGVEMNKEAAGFAASRLDRCLTENVERLDFREAGFAPASIDVVFFPDILEHLYDPWHLLERLKPFLSKDAQVLASIPNVRNIWLINELLAGRWSYTEAGLLDVTHIRFFTLSGVQALFTQTGYTISRLERNVDARVPEIACGPGQTVDVKMPSGTLTGIVERDVWELRTVQFLVDAKPALS